MWLCFVLLFQAAFAARFSGTTPSENNGFVFLGKFVFDEVIDGVLPTFEVSLKIDPVNVDNSAYQNWELLLFDDQDESWPSIYGKDVSCNDARSKARNIPNMPYHVVFSPAGKYDMSGSITQVYRPRYWFIVLASCSTGHVPEAQYEAHLVNSARSAWSRELGTNVMGLNTMYLVIFLLYFPFVCIHFHGVRLLYKKLQFVHPLVKMFGVIIVLQLLVILCNLSYWGAYWHNGHGLPGAKPIAEIGDIIARLCFMLLLILLAKGWTISGEALTQRKQIVGSIVGFGLVFVLLLVLKDIFTDPAATSIPIAIQGIIWFLLGCWLGFALWFAICLRKSHSAEDNPVKKKLYRSLGLFFLPWFLTFPIVDFLTIFINPWRKEVVVETTDVVFSFAAYATLSFLLWPSRAEEFFNISTPDVQKSQVDTYEQL